MPRRKSTKTKTDTAETTPMTAEETMPASAAPQEPAKDTPVYAADPHPKLTVSLSDYSGGPKAQLLRSHKFN